jgi:hypothetical protein
MDAIASIDLEIEIEHSFDYSNMSSRFSLQSKPMQKVGTKSEACRRIRKQFPMSFMASVSE